MTGGCAREGRENGQEPDDSGGCSVCFSLRQMRLLGEGRENVRLLGTVFGY